MVIKVLDDKLSLSRAAAEQAAVSLRRAIAQHGSVRIIAATGASQIDFLDELTKASGDQLGSRRNVSPGRVHWPPR